VDKTTTRILLVEPREDSYQLIDDLFSKNIPGHYELDLAPSYTAALSMVQHRNYDICFAPSHIGEQNAIDMLSEMSKNAWEIPAIVLTDVGESRIDDADAPGRKGAHFLPLGQFGGNFLDQHIRYAMERNRVEFAVMQAKKEWEQIFDAVPDPIAIIDRSYLFQRVNRAMADRLGSKPEDLIGRTCYEVVHGLSSPADFCPMALTLKDGQEHFAEVCEKNLHGIFLVSVSPFFDDHNSLHGGIYIARDITQLKKTEESLRKSKQDLEQKVAICTSELIEKSKLLEESNVTLRVLQRHREEDRAEIQDSVTHNVRKLVFPNLDQMEHGILSKEQLNVCIRDIRNTLEKIISPFPRSMHRMGLTPSETRIAEMIRAGKSNKEIAELFSISDGTLRTHRERIRRKLGLTNRKINLQTYLHSLQ